MPTCKRCGDCCQSISIRTRLPPLTETAKANTGGAEEIMRWFNMHEGIKATLNGDILTIFIEAPCKNLVIVDGLASCLIHSAKPAICKNNFNCTDSIEFIKYRKEKYGR